MSANAFGVELDVRDYECDLEGIVNHAVYLHYLEHARHLYLQSRGFRFAELTRNGLHLVVFRVEADYLQPLRSGDRFRVTADLERLSKLRFCMPQDITRLPDQQRVLAAKVFVTSINAQGRPKHFAELERLFGEASG